MSFAGVTRLRAQILLEPSKAVDAILEAFREAGANMRDTAERLGVTERSLHRYVEELGLLKQVRAIRTRARREGWHKSARWPEKKS